MKVHFYLKYGTTYGQTCAIHFKSPKMGNNLPVLMKYYNKDYWHLVLDLKPGTYNYSYILNEENKLPSLDFEKQRTIIINDTQAELVVVDDWSSVGDKVNIFQSQAFKYLLPTIENETIDYNQNYTHILKVKAPLIAPHQKVCVLGDFNNWNVQSPIIMQYNNGWWHAHLNLNDFQYPVYYKYGFFDTNENIFIGYESFDNRKLLSFTDFSKCIVHDGCIRYEDFRWKGAGVAIPVFSLRSKKSIGVGEFDDIKILADWCKLTGLKLIQLLPINDTIANKTWKDSYPYNAISAFALHPMYINVDKLLPNSFNEEIAQLRNTLNALPVVDYETVVEHKLRLLKEAFSIQRDYFLDDDGFIEYFDAHKDWLVPYASFCYLRDLYGTSDISQWQHNSVYREFVIDELTSPDQEHFYDIVFYYFVQYHLHLQLQEAVDYCHSLGIAIKGDIPIGIARNSVDAWVNPSLYHLNTQAGAPPDDFAVKGQNWGFPTYNWDKMKEDGFAWWKRRFEQMSIYFDAFRIDHILGFFRIWTIPEHAVEGIMGKFVPAIPITKNQLLENGLSWNYDRYCKPFITEEILDEIFGAQKQAIKSFFLNSNENGSFSLKPEFDTQKKIQEFFEDQSVGELKQAQIGLYDLISNFIFFDDSNGNGDALHFRISMQNTLSYKYLDYNTKQQLQLLYIDYFYKRQDNFWREAAMEKLPSLRSSTDMLICGEDLGMVPSCVPGVMKDLSILSLEIQRMPKATGVRFFHPNDAPYLSVVTPSTHDMSTLRGWWEEDYEQTKIFYRDVLGRYDLAPVYCEDWINKDLVRMHLYSPAMWSIFQLQDLMGMDAGFRAENPNKERINVPANPNHYWQYRMHINLEDLMNKTKFNAELKDDIQKSGR